jgi:MFS family permease
VLWGERGAGPGLVLMRMVVFMLAGGLLGGLLVNVIGARVTAALGLAVAAAGLFLMRAWPEVPTEGAAWVVLAVAGLGFTLSDAPLYYVVVRRVPIERRVSIMAVLQVAQTLGMLVGMALLASQGLGRFDRRAADIFEGGVADPVRYREIIHHTFDETFLVAAIVVAGAAALALLCLRHPDREEGQAEALTDVVAPAVRPSEESP